MAGFIVFLFVLLIFGNYILFSGSLSTDLAGNGIAWIIALCALALDGCFIYKVLEEIINCHRKRQEEIKKKQMEMLERQFDGILKRFAPENFKLTQEPIQINIAPGYLNREINAAVAELRKKLAGPYEKLDSVNEELRNFLACEGCMDVMERLSYLRANMEKLERLKAESDTLQTVISKYKIKLLKPDSTTFTQADLNQAFRRLCTSEKCLCDEMSLEQAVPSKKPLELGIFDADADLPVLCLGDFYFSLFSDVILAFDVNGRFSAAIDPSAMRIDVRRKKVSVMVRNGTPNYGEFAASDSKLLAQGATRYFWLHTCRDGSPDLRYSHNPRTESRTDTYEYVTVYIGISDYSVIFTASSPLVGDSFEKMAEAYIRRCNSECDLVPKFLSLMQDLSRGDAQFKRISDDFLKSYKPQSYFCQVVEQ